MAIENINLGEIDSTGNVFSNTKVSEANFKGIEDKMNELISKINELEQRIEELES